MEAAISSAFHSVPSLPTTTWEASWEAGWSGEGAGRLFMGDHAANGPPNSVHFTFLQVVMGVGDG